MVPFFVVDRPISLEIIKGLKIPRGKRIGLMAHANTTSNFRKAFREYPSRQVIKMGDSAIFDYDRYKKKDYLKLFTTYEEMGADYGVIIDVLRDARATIDSAQRALEVYRPSEHSFKLVAVAQGKTIEQYLDCYKQLKDLGFPYIAVGGLLQRIERTARYARVRDEEIMEQVLKQIREQFDPEWLFALGCLHSSRLELFKELNVWGDYKGWIFEYKKRDDTLKETIKRFSTNHLTHAPLRFQASAIGAELKIALKKRRKALGEKHRAHKSLLAAKRTLKDSVAGMYQRLRKRHLRSARLLAPLRTRGLLKNVERDLLVGVLREAGVPKSSRDKLLSLSDTTRLRKAELLKAERRLDACNTHLLSILRRVNESRSANQSLKTVATEIVKVLKVPEQAHRIRQVRTYIKDKILNQL